MSISSYPGPGARVRKIARAGMLAAAALLAGGHLAAQTPGRPDSVRLERATTRLAERLKLDDRQRQEVRSILSEQMERRRALAQDQRERQHEAAERRRVLREEIDTKLARVLNEQQMAEYRKLRDERRERGERMRERRHRGRHDARSGDHEGDHGSH